MLTTRILILIASLGFFLFPTGSQGQTFVEAEQALERKDYATAKQVFEQLATQGDAKSQFQLGYLYRNGFGVPKNFETAASWYRLAAKQGFAKAQVALAIALERGRGLPMNLEEAVAWFRRAAESDDGYAQKWLGEAYLKGIGVQQSPIWSYFWNLIAKYHDPECQNIAAGLKESGAQLTDQQRHDIEKKADEWRKVQRAT